MKRFIYTFFMGLICMATATGQPSYNLVLNQPESGMKVHQATNSITFNPGYSYTTAGGSMQAEIINANNIDPISNNSFVNPASRNLITTPLYLVGTTAGSFDVNPAGGASYTIPIDVLPGVNGLTPLLSLTYSSNSGAGIAGYGWQISGISAISRSQQNYFNDGAVRGVELDYNDKFILDGERLILTSGSYGYDQATYQTEKDIFTRVQSLNSSGNGPEKFLAQTKAGFKNLYGYNDEGRIRVDGYNEVLSWYLTEASDLYGNIISYKYLKNNFMVYPSEIIYGPNKIAFIYKERPDITTSFLKGKKIEQRLLLEKITVSYNSNVVKTYELKYNINSTNYNTYSLLNEVIEYGEGGSQYNSTAFSYKIPSNITIGNYKTENTNNDVSYKRRLWTGDFNGDGKTDIFSLDDTSIETSLDGWKLNINYGNVVFDYTSGDFSIDERMIQEVIVMDLNGDGMDDLIFKYDTGVNKNYYHNGIIICREFNYYYSLSTGTSFGTLNFITTDPVPISSITGILIYNPEREKKQIVDFDGDGLNDFFLVTIYGWKIYSFSYLNNILSPLSLKKSGTSTSFGKMQYEVDLNGDGKSELMTVDANGAKIYSFNGTDFSLLCSSTAPTINNVYKLGDYNGDGKTDMFLYGDKANDWENWQMHTSNGIGFEITNIYRKINNLKADSVRTGDFNGDGCTDLMVMDTTKTTIGWPGHYYLFSKNKGKDFDSYFLASSIAQLPSINYFLGDFNGDGQTDYLCTDGKKVKTWNGYKVYWQTSPGNNVPLLSNIADGLNNRKTISYTKLSQASNSVYQKGGVTIFPILSFQGPLPVVSSVSADNGLGGANLLRFYYEEAKIHRQGKGFLCYLKTKVTDIAANIETVTQMGYHSTYYYPKINTITKRTSDIPASGGFSAQPGYNIETTSNTWAEVVLDDVNKRYLPYVSSTTQTDLLTTNGITTSVSGYDNYGNPGTVTKTYKTGDVITGTESYANLYQSENISAWLLGRATKTTITHTKGNESIIQVINREYSDSTMRDTVEIRYPGTDKEIRYSHVYCSNGNLRKETTTTGGVSRTTSYVYNSDNVRINKITDPLGHVTTRKYYSTNGLLSSESDYLNNKDSLLYDGLGRISKKIQWDGFETTQTYSWAINAIANSTYYITSSGNDGSVSKTWYDKLNREIRKDVKSFDGSDIYTVTKYNLIGQLDQVSQPSTSTTPTQWSKYSYNTDGNIDRIEKPSGNFIIYNYGNFIYRNRLGVTIAGKSTWKETDSQGLVTRAHDNGGDILYDYFPDGKIKTITAPGGVVTRMKYADAARNQTKLIDPSAGNINYTYDGFGQLLTQTDTLNQTTTYNYYADGRINRIIAPEGTTIYAYNANKQLSGITSPNNVSITYGFDSKGRINSVNENISGSSFITTFTYDSKGRLDTKTHPGGVVEKNNYNPNTGYFDYISVGSSTLYKITGMNARQQITAATYGSGPSLNATYGYDDYGYPSSTAAGSIQNYQYLFDEATGNLKWRKNVNRSNITENFIYDSLDRLDSIYGNDNSIGGFDIDLAKGNITRKSGIGKLGYNHPSKPYAITDLMAISSPYPTTPDTIKQRAYYTSFNKIKTISDYPSYRADYLYNADHQRVKMTVTQNGANVVTRTYAGSSFMRQYINNVTMDYTYIGGDAYTAPIVAVKTYGTIVYYYLLRDYLGNITHVVKASDNTYSEYSFDAWGRRRNPANWSYDLTGQPELFADRGYTDHEHLKWFNAINMNGRLYDPLLGRLLSPDINVSYPDNTQSFNRYSYALNNPLKFTDLDGNNPMLALIIWGAYFGGAQANANGQNVWKGALVGAASAAAGGLAGGAAAAAVGTGGFLGGAISGFAGGFAGGFVNVAGNSWLSGQSFGQGFFKGFESGFSSGLISGGIGGMVGGYSSISGPPRGTISETPKGTFWEGHYKTGAFTASTGDDIVNGGTLPEVTVHGTAGMGLVKDIAAFYGAPHMMDYTGFWGRLQYFCTGGRINGVQYDWNGKLTGLAPIMGIVETPGRGIKVLQTGGHILKPSTLKALKLTKGEGKIAIEGLKGDIGLSPNFHGKIMSNGDLVHPQTNSVLGNLFDYLY